MKSLRLPLIENNINQQDLDEVTKLFKFKNPILTHSVNVRKFEEEWSKWLGTKYSVYVNSGSSANFLSIFALKEIYGLGEVIIPPLTWVSDIGSLIHFGFKPVFVDINPRTLGMDNDQAIEKITSKTKAVFITHILGYNAFSQKLLDYLKKKNIPLIEDVCESYGAIFKNKRLGAFGLMSNFSFYYAHHMSTIEGGMVSTNNKRIYEMVRMLRSHGMVRESDDINLRDNFVRQYPDLNPDFIFAYPGFNMRPTEIGAVIGRSQLKRIDENNKIRSRNLEVFLANLDSEKYQTDFEVKGSCNYAFTLVLKKKDPLLRDKIMKVLKSYGVEFRRGTSGGGNQLRQPYLRKITKEEYRKYPNVEHVHFFGFYIGNFPSLQKEKILKLCSLLNGIK